MTHLEFDISKITNNLYLGDRHTANNQLLLQGLNITSIVVAAHQLQPKHTSSFRYLHLPLRDHKSEDLLPHLENSFKFIDQARNKGEAVFVHCSYGVSRSASIVIGYLIKKLGISYTEAFGAVRRKRRIIKPNSGFEQQLNTLSERRKTQ